MHISGAEALMHGRRDGLDYRETGIIEELKLEKAVANPQRRLMLGSGARMRWRKQISLLLNTSAMELW